MLVINLWGGPGAGKSTVAAEVFVKLRQRTKANVELTNEFATELCFEGAKENLKVDVAVCDSPIGMGTAYDKDIDAKYATEYMTLVYKLRHIYPAIDIMIDRDIYAEGGFKGNSKKRHNVWINSLDKRIAKLANADCTVLYSKDSAGAEVAEFCIPRVRKYIVQGYL
jgi:hypothetical protein